MTFDRSKARRLAAVVGAAALVAGSAACGSGTSDSGGGGDGGGGDGAPATSAKVAGTLKPSVFISGDKEAIGLLRASKVFCRWNDGEVEVGATLHNGLAAHITVHIQPNYRLKRGGLHGDGLGSQQDVGVDGDATRAWSNRIGKPAGITGQPAITECAPEINSVELG